MSNFVFMCFSGIFVVLIHNYFCAEFEMEIEKYPKKTLITVNL